MGTHFYVYFYWAPAALRAALPASLYDFVLVSSFLGIAVKHVSGHLVYMSTVMVSFCDSVLCFVICDSMSSVFTSQSPAISTANLTPVGNFTKKQNKFPFEFYGW